MWCSVSSDRRILLLQGPLSSLYSRLGRSLQEQGAEVCRVNFNLGDQLHWRSGPSINYRGTVEQWPTFIASLLESRGITDLVVHGDRRYYHKIAIELARARGIYVAVTELGLIRPGRLTLERNGLGLLSHFPSDPDRIKALSASLVEPEDFPAFTYPFAQMAAWDVSYNLLNFFMFWLYPGYRKHTPYNPLVEYTMAAWRLLRGKSKEARANAAIEQFNSGRCRYFVFPLQLSGDFQVRDYSPFSSMKPAIEAVIRSFAHFAPPDSFLLIKQHPLDPGLDGLAGLVKRIAVSHQIAKRVCYIDGGDLGQAYSGADGVVVVNSSAAMQALEMGVPVIALAPAIFAIEGLTFMGGLDDFWNSPRPPDAGLFDALLKLLKHTTQLPGGLYGHNALEVAVSHISQRILTRQLNAPYAYEVEPPRLNNDVATWFRP